MSRSTLPLPLPSKKASAALALHRVGNQYRYVLAASGGSGSAGGALRVTDSGTIATGDPKALEALRSKAGSAAVVVQVIPPEASILRPAPPKLVLDGTPEQIAGSLALVAEAELPSTVPEHRRAAGVLRAGHAHAVYAVGWIGPEGAFAPQTVAVPAVQALAALHRLCEAPEGVAAFADSASGVVAIVVAGRGESPRLFVRVLRDDASDPQAFAQVRDEAIEDARNEVSVGPPVAVGKSLWLPKRPSAHFGLAGDDRLAEFALALGAAAAVLEARPDEQPFLTMTDRSPTAGRSILTRISDGLATPRAAAIAAAACVALVLGAWILAAPIKLAILQSRVGAETGDYTEALQQHDWYKALREKRWPMTAIMAELTSGAPEGVRIETLTIDQGRPITLTGTAENADAVYAWCKSLRGKIFSEATPTIPLEDASPVRFTIKADVLDPMLAAVSELKPVVVSDAARARTEPSPRNDRTTRPTTTGTGSSRTGTTPAAGTPSTAAAEPPPPISDAQIAKLSMGPATIEWAKRQGQLSRSDLDPATRKRLEHERDRISERRKALGAGQ
ncbi:MAG: PilN domain-containing protein [Phycisphaerales bacterium]|nr:PilN domain-containing protein [Phycisphaerales bacterium]